MSRATTDQIDYDQWTVATNFDSDRPLKRIALHDSSGTEIYISSKSGDVVLTTTRNERLLNYAGSIPHWLYPTQLRHHRCAWNELMWWISPVATVGVAFGALLGLVRLGTGPVYHGLRRWHHISGLIVAPFLLSWIFSGFLSLDDGWFTHSDVLFRTMHALDFSAANVTFIAALLHNRCTLPLRFRLQLYRCDFGLANGDETVGTDASCLAGFVWKMGSQQGRVRYRRPALSMSPFAHWPFATYCNAARVCR